MKIIFQKNTYVILTAVVVAVIVVLVLLTSANKRVTGLVTETVENGDVIETVSVSGFVEAKNTANLAFPVIGKVTEVFVDEGFVVKKDEVLATLASRELVARRNEAVAALQVANAVYKETLSGPTTEARAVTSATIKNAEENLKQVKTEYNKKVQNALITLRSDTLEALASDLQKSATPPTISGTYTCTEEGSYSIEVYRSSSLSKYSYRYIGLESGTETAYIDQPGPLGTCGLYIQFSSSGQYNNSIWNISIPNTHGSNYIINKNAYELLLKQQINAIATARNALHLVEKKAIATNANARTEVVKQRSGTVAKARARIAQIDAQLADRSIVAPFDGIITNVSIISGETASVKPVITVLASGSFELKARIPEIDITKIILDQSVDVVFDAKTDEVLTGKVSYISPLATEIDGVAYFETTITLDKIPDWIRAGLNADIDIIIQTKNNILRIPSRFAQKELDGTYFVIKIEGDKTTKVPIKIILNGNNGFMAITGLSEGDTVVAPEQN